MRKLPKTAKALSLFQKFKTIDTFGIFDPAYIGQEFEGIPHPAIFILDKKRKVLFVKIEPNYRKRPTNAELRVEIDKIK